MARTPLFREGMDSHQLLWTKQTFLEKAKPCQVKYMHKIFVYFCSKRKIYLFLSLYN